MGLCTSSVVTVTSLYGSYLSYLNNVHRDTTVLLTEARTKMIHDQRSLEKGFFIELARVFQLLPSSTEKKSRFSYVLDKHANIADKKTAKTAHETVTIESNGLSITRPG